MNRTMKTLLQVTLALLLAGATGLLLYRWMDNGAARGARQAAKPATVNVVVAARDLPRGALLTADTLKTAPFLPESLPARTFSAPAELEGRVLASPLAANDPVTELRLAPDNIRAGGVSALITPGRRAMTVKGNKVMGLAGFVRPGNRVDVLVTLITGEQDSQPVTKLVLSNVLVLATGEQFEASPEGGEPSPVDTYTLEVTVEESERLALASNQGTLNFALRSENDNETALTEGVDVEKALASFRPGKPKAKAVARRSAPEKRSIEIISGSERSNVSF
ncbi:MAG: Flp pilus assembly protein CpaB [Desulfovibrionaceae bacterium]